MAKVGTLTDNFTTADSGKWAGYNGTTVAVVSGQAAIVPDSTFTRELITQVTYDAADSSVTIELASIGSAQIFSLNLQDDTDSTDRIDMQYDFGNIRLREMINGTSNDTTVTYSATNHRWWRIRFSGTSVFWEASPTGLTGTWTVLRSKTWAVPSLATMNVSLIAYTTSGTTAALVDNLNLPPSPLSNTGSFWPMFFRSAPQSAPAAPSGPFTQAFYVSPTGNDNNVGNDPGLPWQTMARAGQNNYVAGEGLLFERGGTYYGGYLNETPTPSSGKRFTIGAYGSGARPILTAYKLLNVSGAWTNVGGNVWRIDLTNSATHGGQQGQPTGVTAWNVGHLRVGSSTFGVLQTSTAALSAQWQFFGQNPYLYVYSVGNPTTVAGGSGLRAAPQVNIIQCHGDTEINGIEIEGTGAHGIADTGSGTVSNILVTDTVIHHIGGSILFGTTRYGNGVEFWMGTSNTVMQDSEVYDCYDAGVTVQGGGADANAITFQRNNLHDSSFNYEIFTQDTGRMFNVLFANNTCSNAGGGWGGPVRPNQDTRGTHVALTGDLVGSGNVIRNNTFTSTPYSGPAASGSYVFSLQPFPKTPLAMNNNSITLPTGKRINWLTQHLITQGAAYQAATGMEAGSTFTAT